MKLLNRKLHFGPLTPDRLKMRVVLASIFVAIAFLTLVSKALWDTRSNIYTSVDRDLRAHSQLVLLNVVEGLNLADFTLKRARKEWLSSNVLRTHEEFLSDFPNFKELIVQVAVIDEAGYLVASSLNPDPKRVFLGDREHFQKHLGIRSDQVFVSRPIVGRVSGETTIQFTRPIFDSDAVFRGVMVVSLDPNYLINMNFKVLATVGFQSVLMGEDGHLRVQLSADPAHSIVRKASYSDEWAQHVNHAGSVLSSDFIWQERSLEGFNLKYAVGYPRSEFIKRSKLIFWSAGLVSLLFLALVAWYTWRIVQLIDSRNRILIKLEEINVQANSANEMKSKFVSGISHELRTPLNGILGFAELIGMSASLEEARKYGAVIHSSAEHLHRLVNTLLDLAKIEAGQMSVVRTDSDIRALLESVVGLYRYEAERKGLLLNLTNSEDLPAIMRVDRIKLMQVINNLVSNAIKFTEQGAVFVRASFNDGRWEFVVADSGVGMSAEQVAGVFDRFNNIKLEHASTSDKQGAGLGMALCKELVEVMGGQIEVQSELGVGTSVKIVFTDVTDENSN